MAVADDLRSQIFEGSLSSGTPLREIALAQFFEVSRRTVREALLLLASEGLVVHKHNQGAHVKVFTMADVHDLYRIRRVLELEGARFVSVASEEQLARVTVAMEGIRDAAAGGLLSPELARADVGFHASIIALIGSPGIDKFYEQSGNQTAYALLQLQRHDASQAAEVAATVYEHQAIHDAVVGRNALDAQRLILEHIERHESSFLHSLREVALHEA
ncbi:GntR family transcriptional regulator [Leucobacter chinensis]|uniref:GntR family transcriptional regulator n=1 Tax=Leucobacter chinensis TaxID=2851010 RepID=UPI001C24565A